MARTISLRPLVAIPSNFFRSAHGASLALFVVAYLSAVHLVRNIAARDPTSYFVNPEVAYSQRYTPVRVAQADAYVANTTGEGVKAAPDPYLCVGIVTVQRPAGKRYFHTTVGSLLDGLSDEERREISLISFIANADPRAHPAVNETWVKDLSDRVETYDSLPEQTRSHMKFVEVSSNNGHYEKALYDYAHILGLCEESNAAFTLLIEDDVIAMKGWYARTKAALHDLQSRRDYDRALYLRLFYTQEFLGWNGEAWPQYLFWSAVVEFGIAAVLIFMRRWSRGRLNHYLTYPVVAMILVLYVPACVALFFAAGAPTVMPPTHGISKMNRFGCCSQAMIFPREQVPGLRAWYGQHKSGWRDSLMEIWAEKNGLDRYAVTPSLVQHIGTKSTKNSPQATNVRKWNRVAAALVWNYDFEDYEDDVLSRGLDADQGYTYFDWW